MAKISNENKGKMISLFMAGNDISAVSAKTKLSLKAVKSFYSKVMALNPEREEKEDKKETEFDYPGYILDLVEQGINEKDAYYCVYSTVLEEDFKTQEQFDTLVLRKIQEQKSSSGVHKSGRAVTMTDGSTQESILNRTGNKVVYSDTINRADGL